MEYVDIVVSLIYDWLEDFFKFFTLVSGRSTFRVLLFAVLYLIIAVIAEITDKFTFVSVWSGVVAVVIMLIITCVSSVQRKDIMNFKKLLKGDIKDE